MRYLEQQVVHLQREVKQHSTALKSAGRCCHNPPCHVSVSHRGGTGSFAWPAEEFLASIRAEAGQKDQYLTQMQHACA